MRLIVASDGAEASIKDGVDIIADKFHMAIDEPKIRASRMLTAKGPVLRAPASRKTIAVSDRRAQRLTGRRIQRVERAAHRLIESSKRPRIPIAVVIRVSRFTNGKGLASSIYDFFEWLSMPVDKQTRLTVDATLSRKRVTRC